jgi:hypothetical protein
MRKFVILCVLLITLSNCVPDGFYGTETAIAGDYTPTQETGATDTPTSVPAPVVTATANPSNMWNLDCLQEEEHRDTFRNPNPCLSGQVRENLYGASQVRPLQYSVVFAPDLFGVIHGTDMWFEGGTRINVTMWTGGVGLGIPWLTLDNSCHLLIVHTDSTINLLPDANRVDAASNFFVGVTLSTSNGEQLYLTDAPIATTWTEVNGQVHYEFNGQNQTFLFPFYFEDLWTEVQIDVLFRSTYGIANHGSTFTFKDIILVKPDDPGNCDGVTGF